jgi:hypothetical protein
VGIPGLVVEAGIGHPQTQFPWSPVGSVTQIGAASWQNIDAGFRGISFPKQAAGVCADKGKDARPQNTANVGPYFIVPRISPTRLRVNATSDPWPGF